MVFHQWGSFNRYIPCSWNILWRNCIFFLLTKQYGIKDLNIFLKYMFNCSLITQTYAFIYLNNFIFIFPNIKTEASLYSNEIGKKYLALKKS